MITIDQDSPVLQRITHLSAQMSKSYKLIANVIINNPDEAAFYNVAEMAKKANVSESTITRFAVFLGYSGFPALSRELQEIVRSHLTTGERFLLSRELENDDQRTIIQFFEDDVQNIMLTMERTDLGAIQRTVKSLLAARRVGIVCSRSTVSLGLFLEFYLNILDIDVVIFTGDPRTIDLLHKFGPEDVIFAISFARYSRFAVECLRFAAKKGARVIALTDYPSSPLANHAHELLLTPTGIASHMDSFVAPLSLLTVLLRAMAHRIPERVTDALKALEDVWTDFSIYVDPKK